MIACGGGASSVLLAHALAKTGREIDLTIIDHAPEPGRGVAYGTTCVRHLLNVRVAGMSADEDDAGHLLAWLAGQDDARPHDSFLPRQIYGAYLRDVLRTAGESGALRLSLVHGTAEHASRTRAGWKVALDDGRSIRGDALVLATGNDVPAPITVPGARALRSRLIANPWDQAAIADIPSRAHVMLLGSGLTAIDAVLSLLDQGHKGRITALSRHGLLPHVHGKAIERPLWIAPPYPPSLPALLRTVRRHVRKCRSEHAIEAEFDALRPILGDLWSALSPRGKRQFVRHMSARWNVYRHRMAPEIGAEVDAALARGQLKVRSGRLRALRRGERGFTAEFDTGGEQERFAAQVLINCTGPALDPARSANPLLRDLLNESHARADALKLGLDVDARSRVVDAKGRTRGDIFALGALAKGRFWEITAIPEIRAQAAAVARTIAAMG